MSAAWIGAAAFAGFVVGALFVSLAIVRPMRQDRDAWKGKVTTLLTALRPFAPVKVRRVNVSVNPGQGWHYWACGACSPYGLLGGPWRGEATLDRTNDEAREHYLDHHMTRENVEQAGKAMAEVLGADRWWKR